MSARDKRFEKTPSTELSHIVRHSKRKSEVSLSEIERRPYSKDRVALPYSSEHITPEKSQLSDDPALTLNFSLGAHKD